MKKISYHQLLFFLLLFFGNIIAAQAQETNALNDTTYMLTYDHGGLILWGSDHFNERLESAAEWLDKYPGFKIGLDNEAQIYDYFAENEPEMIDKLKNYIDKYSGRFGIGSCTYGQPLSQFICDESNIRQISYALKTERENFNYRPPVYIMSEHAMHSQIPQIIKGFGFDGAIMRTHFMMYGFNPVFDVPIGWWVGIDGSRMPTIPTYKGEGAAFGKTTDDMWILTRYPGPDSKAPMETFREKFNHIYPLLATRADDSDLRKEELVKEYETKPKFKWVLLDEIMDKYPEPTYDMVTLPNDFTVRMPWGYCGNEIWNNSRKAEVSVLISERLAAMEVLNGGQSHEHELDKSWKRLLLAQHHDVQIVGLLPEARQLLSVSLQQSQKVISESMAFFAERINEEAFKQVTVFNPLSWKQNRWIFANVSLQKGEAKNFVAKFGDDKIPVHIISSNNYSDGSVLDAQLAFKADLAPLSINSFFIIPDESPSEVERSTIEADVKNLNISTPYYQVQLSEEGGLTSIINRKTGELITSEVKKTLFFEGTIEGKNYISKGKWIIRKSGKNTPWIKMIEYGFISDIPYEFEMTLYETNPRIDCKVKFDFNGQKIGLLSNDLRDSHSPFVHEEKLRFKFFPNIDNSAVGIRDLPFAISETKNKYVEGNYWTAISDGNTGIAFLNQGNMGSIREKDGSFSIPLAYSMYYIWGTRMLTGTYNYEFAILPFKGNWEDADLHKKALEYSFDVPALETFPKKGKNNKAIRKFDIENGNDIILTALYPQEENIVARFFKCSDRSKTSPILFDLNSGKMNETSLDGKFKKPFNGKTELKSWEIKTIQIPLR